MTDKSLKEKQRSASSDSSEGEEVETGREHEVRPNLLFLRVEFWEVERKFDFCFSFSVFFLFLFFFFFFVFL